MTIAEAAGMPASTLHYCSAGTPAKATPTPAHPAKNPAKTPKKKSTESYHLKQKAGLFEIRLLYCRTS